MTSASHGEPSLNGGNGGSRLCCTRNRARTARKRRRRGGCRSRRNTHTKTRRRSGGRWCRRSETDAAKLAAAYAGGARLTASGKEGRKERFVYARGIHSEPHTEAPVLLAKPHLHRFGPLEYGVFESCVLPPRSFGEDRRGGGLPQGSRGIGPSGTTTSRSRRRRRCSLTR